MADGFTPPKGVQDNAARGLELRREFGRGGTAVGVARARDLSNGKSIPLKTVNRMVSYFARHEVDKEGENWGNRSNPSNGYIAWLLWGGDAGKTWANSIAEREKKRDKSMAINTTTAYAAIIKQEKLEDGTLLVHGKATDDSLDIDQQICDATWLNKAMPEWFKTGGNIREQHSNIAAGVAKELDSTADGHYITALVVDPVSVKKVENGVLKGFSIGIRAPRIVRDEKAANGRIIDGQIVEVSLVDRPANPNAKLMLAKSDNGGDLEKVEELIETDESAKGADMEHDEEKAATPPSKEEALKRLEEARKMYKEAEKMCKELGYLDKEDDEDEEHEDEELEKEPESDKEKREYGESAEEESEEGPSGSGAEHELEEAHGKKVKETKSEKCLECGCHDVSNNHGGGDTVLPDGTQSHMTSANIVSPTQTPKSTILPPPTYEDLGTEIVDGEEEELSDKTVTAIIAKAVKSAKESVTAEIVSYKEEINKLQDELATARSKAVAGGPKRTVIKTDIDAMGELLAKAAEYRAKSAVTSDKDLARGYKELAEDFESKAKALQAK